MMFPRSFSIQHIALAFITGLLLLVSVIGGFAAYQTRSVTGNLERHSQDAARAELTTAVQRLLSQTKDQAANLAGWDETRQQLVMPEYYTHWRDQRVYESGMLGSALARTALYGPSGDRFAPGPGQDLPSRFPLPVHAARLRTG
jgi:hypothetical protein